MRILLAVADPTARMLWEEVLATRRHTAAVTTPDLIGWARAQELRPELALVELVGNGESGLRLCRQLCAVTGWRPEILALVRAEQTEAMAAALKAEIGRAHV